MVLQLQRALVCLAMAVFAVALSRPANAWLNLSVKSDAATVELDRDGSAVVRHELLLRVRGGPLEQFTLNGVDDDAQPFEDATLTRAQSGRAAGPPILLVPKYDGEQLHLVLSISKGVRSGSYLVRFAYRTQLETRGLLAAQGDSAVVSWKGLHFDDGIDSLQTTFVVPRAARAPHLPNVETDEAVSMLANDDGVFLSELQRSADQDRLQLSRPHVAKHERVTWTATLDRSVFDGLPRAEMKAPLRPATSVDAFRMPKPLLHGIGLWAAILGVAFGFVFVVNLKRRLTRTDFIVPLRGWLRQLALFGSMTASLAWALIDESASLAGLALLTAMLLTLQKPVRAPIVPKGPGKWRPVDLETVDAPEGDQPSRALWLDASSGVGLGLFTIAILAFAVLGLRLLGQAPYHSAMTLVYSTALVPLFFTLGSPTSKSLVREQSDFLIRLTKRLRRSRGVEASAVGRFALDAGRPDELRLALNVSGACTGLVSLEVGLGFVDTSLRRLLVPALVVRVREDSPAHRALPRDAHWSRGRDAEERIAVIRAPLPLLASCVECVSDVVARLREEAATEQNPRRRKRRPQSPETRSAKSGGKSRLTSKVGTPALPSQATR
jgi:hypothetical protein